MEIQVKNKYHYWGKIPSDVDVDPVEGWEPDYYFRFVIETREEEIRIEDRAGRVVPIDFQSVNELTQVVNKVQQEIICSVVGAPNNA